MNTVFPDYQNSILSAASSLLRHYGVETAHSGLAAVDQALSVPCKNKIMIILDGMGSEFLRRMLPADCFFRRHFQCDLSSVYPCTTTAATTTLLSGQSPAEHGWIGWSCWFKEFGRSVDLFLDRDSLNGTPVEPSPAQSLLPFDDLTARIERASPNAVQCRKVLPPFAENGVGSFLQFSARIKEFCQMPGEQLILAYWYEPDTLMHKYGPYHDEVRQDVLEMDKILSQLQGELDSTLMIVTADHGQVEVQREIFLDDYPDLMDCLLMPPSMEVRAASLFVKASQTERFEALFQDRFGDCFLLMPREEVFASGLLGPGTLHRKVDDFVGDYLACATGQTILRYRSLFNRPRTPFKGHHAGLCVDEMMVPLIISHK